MDAGEGLSYRDRGGPAASKSTTAALPLAVLNSVSRMRVPGRYRRLTARDGSLGAISQRPCSAFPSRVAKHAAESKRGQHNQSIEPSRPTKAAVLQSPISA